MKSKLVLASVVAALSGLAGFVSTANAGTDLRIRVGVGSHHRRPPAVRAPDCRPGGWTYSYSAPGYDYRNPRSHQSYRAPQGCWKDVVVRTWVPAQWVVSCDRYGRQIRTLQPGYYAERINRVWVGHDRG